MRSRARFTAGPGFYNPPWMLLLLAPFAMLPQQTGFVVWTVIGVACYALAFRRMGIEWPASVILIFSPLVVGNLIFGNYDWLILFGATLPAAWGIWFVALKPQLGGAVSSLLDKAHHGWQLREATADAQVHIPPVSRPDLKQLDNVADGRSVVLTQLLQRFRRHRVRPPVPGKREEVNRRTRQVTIPALSTFGLLAYLMALALVAMVVVGRRTM